MLLKRVSREIKMKKKVLMIDNYDSFTYNLVHYIEELGPKVLVKRNDEIRIEQIKYLSKT